MVSLIEDQFDLYTEKKTGKSIPVKRFTWENHNRVSVQVINYGATIISIKVPSKNGIIEDIVTGFSDLKGYQNPDNPYFGATIGRVANRIGFGQVRILESVIPVTKNHGKHQLHGGFVGFDKVMWESYVNGNKLILSYHSADGQEGYPGDLVVHTIFELTNYGNQFSIEFKATTTKPTCVNLLNHSYFNLAGHNKGASELYKHVVCINADRITLTDPDNISTGFLKPVADTVFDFQVPRVLGDVIKKVPNSDGFDHNFCITTGQLQGKTFVARLYHPDSGRLLEVYSNQPGVHFYTANSFPEDPNLCKGDKKYLKTLPGKAGNYYKHGALCFETQNWPDAPNHKHFPKAILCPGQTYYHYLVYKFSIRK